MPTPANSMNLSAGAGVVSWDGASSLSSSSVTQHDVLIGGASQAITSVTPSTATKYLISNGTGSDPSFQAPTGGIVQQVRQIQNGSYSTTTIFPSTGAIPTNTAGIQVCSLAITPKSTSNWIKMEFSTYTSQSTNVTHCWGLFQSGVTNALSATWSTANVQAQVQMLTWVYMFQPSGTSATTYTIRWGPNSAATTYLNIYYTGAQFFGGVEAISFILTEVFP